MALPKLARWSWGILAYNLVVIAWGAFVRATGSGAGCGRHWPLCNGEVLPRDPGVAMAIELTHRMTSGVALVLVVAFAVVAFRRAPKGHPVRAGAVASVVFMVMEALLGAFLVLFELVAHDASMKRALSMSLHLVNTFLLLAALTLTAFWASGGSRLRVRGQGAVLVPLAIPFVTLLLVGTSGAVAALGDTLFPAASLSEGLAQDLSPTAHAFLKLRSLHPMLATLGGLFVVGASAVTRSLRRTARVVRASRVLTAMFVGQMCLGIVNLLLLAPVAVQLLHLLLADAVWIASVLLAAEVLSERDAEGTLGRDGAAVEEQATAS